ncbi:MAG: FtsH protease activity modulator HflK [Hyphomonadaceae bacterium]|nr:FtsH protease activity modulator HflK [Hyphomonadaceae bacterium]
MPWNDQSGGDGDRDRKNGPKDGPKDGPWGAGGGGQRPPWGQQPRRPRRGGGDTPDLEEMLRRWRERAGRFPGMGGGGGAGGRRGGPGGVWVIAGLLFAGWLASGVFVVDAGEQGVVTRFGAHQPPNRAPGLHYHLPAPFEGVQVVNVTGVQRLDVPVRENQSREDEGLMITSDRNIVDVGFTVLYRLSSAENFLFNVRDPEEAIRAVAESAMREVVGQRELQAIITTERAGVEQAAEQLMQRVLDDYGAGVQIQQVQLQKADAPPQVIDAFNDVVRAGQDRQAAINRAEQYRNEIVPRARGEAQQQLQQAEAYREQVVREANGEAARFTSVLTEYRRAPRVTRERLYLEAMERVYRGADKIIIDRGAGVQPYLPLEQIRRTPAQPQPSQPAAEPPAPAPQAQR